MPILDVEIVGPNEARRNVAAALADAAAHVLRAERGHTWVKVRFLAPDQYAEDGGTPAGVRPAFISVLLRHAGDAEKARIASGLAAAFADVLDRPAENIHVIFEPDASGRVAFGGEYTVRADGGARTQGRYETAERSGFGSIPVISVFAMRSGS